MNPIEKNFEHLMSLSKQIRILEGVTSLLDWDQETYMPEGSSSIRAEQLKTLAGITHRLKTGKKYGNALSKLIEIKTGAYNTQSISLQQKAALREWRRDYLHNTALPTKFIEDLTQLTSQAIVAWRSAKKNNAFLQFAPFLEKIVSMNRKKADLLGFKEHPYDALLDQYEPEMTTKEVSSLFNSLRQALTPLLKKIENKPVNNEFLHGKWDHMKQIAFGKQILNQMGFPLKYGRLDESVHPFSSASHPTDSRITTRIHPTSLMSNIFAVLHEAGHGLYEMGLPTEWYGTPLGDSRSLGVHESQSRWWETRIGMSRPFWKYFFPILQETFKGAIKDVSFDAFYQAINKVNPSFIRIEADELTYPLHVILRFEIERGLIEGSIKIREIPEIWNSKMKEYLGITPSTYEEGCLQDIHWSMGGIGYFPTYTLGNIYASHLFETFQSENPSWEKKIENGELIFVKDWLGEKIHRHGKFYGSKELIEQASGKELSSKAYLDYLSTKFTKLYKL